MAYNVQLTKKVVTIVSYSGIINRNVYSRGDTKMSNNQEQMKELINNLRAGEIDKESFCKAIQKDVNSLVYPVFGDDYKKISAKAIIDVCDRLDYIDVDKNIMRQIATMVSAFMFSLIDSSTVKVDDYEYEYSKIKEDAELFNIIKNNSKIFRNMKAYDMAADNIRGLSRVQTIIMELYGYEMHSVEEIEQLLDVDSAFVSKLIAMMKENLLGTSAPVVDYEDSEPEEADDEYQDESETQEQEEDSQDNDYDDSEEDDSDEGVSFEYDMDGYGEEPEYPQNFKKSIMEKLTDFVGRVFPKVSRASRRNVVYTGIILIIIVIILVVSVAAFAGGNSKRKVKKTRSEWTPMEYTTRAPKETATAKETQAVKPTGVADNKTTAAAETKSESDDKEEKTKETAERTTDNRRNNVPDENLADDDSLGNNDDNSSDDGDNKTDDDKTDETKPTDDKTDETKPSDDKTDETKPSDDKTDETKPTDDKTDETKPSDDKSDNKTDDDNKSDDKSDDTDKDNDKPSVGDTSTEN